MVLGSVERQNQRIVKEIALNGLHEAGDFRVRKQLVGLADARGPEAADNAIGGLHPLQVHRVPLGRGNEGHDDEGAQTAFLVAQGAGAIGEHQFAGKARGIDHDVAADQIAQPGCGVCRGKHGQNATCNLAGVAVGIGSVGGEVDFLAAVGEVRMQPRMRSAAFLVAESAVEYGLHAAQGGIGFGAFGGKIGAASGRLCVGCAHGRVGGAAFRGNGIHRFEQGAEAFEFDCAVAMALIVVQIIEDCCAPEQQAADSGRCDPHPLQMLYSEHDKPHARRLIKARAVLTSR